MGNLIICMLEWVSLSFWKHENLQGRGGKEDCMRLADWKGQPVWLLLTCKISIWCLLDHTPVIDILAVDS